MIYREGSRAHDSDAVGVRDQLTSLRTDALKQGLTVETGRTRSLCLNRHLPGHSAGLESTTFG